MPVTPTYPGVYIQEVPSGVRTISPVATSITAFIGAAPWGPDDKPTPVLSFAEFERKFGGLVHDHPMGYAVQHFFSHGGGEALIVRVAGDNSANAKGSVNGLNIEAASPGGWGNTLRIRIDHATKNPTDVKLFNLFLYDDFSKLDEEFRNVSIDDRDPKYVVSVLAESSTLARISAGQGPTARPSASGGEVSGRPWFDVAGAYSTLSGGKPGDGVQDKHLIAGIAKLKKAELVNLLCIPPTSFKSEVTVDVYNKALTFCVERRCMLLVDPPLGWTDNDKPRNEIDKFRSELGDIRSLANAAVFFPRIRMADPLKENRSETFPPSGAIAGIMARTDVERGVWKSPAGVEAGFRGVREFTVKMDDPQNGQLNIRAVNCLRNFRAYGNVVWGARTLAGSDEVGSEWKYLAVRRFALFLEESLYRGTQWVVFEPNDEPLWAQIRLNIGSFLHDLFRQGAFQGRTSRDAYFVKCDKDTTTQSDINRGIVNIEVGFAPLKPAEFVIIKVQQIAGKLET